MRFISRHIKTSKSLVCDFRIYFPNPIFAGMRMFSTDFPNPKLNEVTPPRPRDRASIRRQCGWPAHLFRPILAGRMGENWKKTCFNWTISIPIVTKYDNNNSMKLKIINNRKLGNWMDMLLETLSQRNPWILPLQEKPFVNLRMMLVMQQLLNQETPGFISPGLKVSLTGHRITIDNSIDFQVGSLIPRFHVVFFSGLGGFQLVMGVPPMAMDGLVHGKSHRSKWMITGGTPSWLRKPPWIIINHY